MSIKDNSMTTPNNTMLQILQAAVDTQFQPAPPHREAKSAFWSSFSSEATSPLPAENLATALRFGRNPKIKEWWDLPGFQDWFWNRDEFRQKMEYLASMAVLGLEDILANGKDTDRINAIKLIMQVTGKTGTPTGEESLPDTIQKMSRSQLEEYIRSGIRLLSPIEPSPQNQPENMPKALTPENKSDTVDK